MTHGRIETTPEQQLAELRMAYARYATLAERWREQSDIDPDEREAREQDARRIAHAYEKTIASTALRLESMHRTHAEPMRFTPLAKGLSVMLGVTVVAGGAAVAYLRPELFRDLMPRGRAVAVNAPIPMPAAPAANVAAPAAEPAAAPAAKPAIAPAAKPAIASAPVAKPAARPAPSPKQAAALPPAKAPAVTPKPAPPKAAAPSGPVKAQAPAAPRLATAAPLIAAPPPQASTAQPQTPAAQQAKIEPLSPPKEVLPLPIPPKSDTPNAATPPKPAEVAAVAPQTAAVAPSPAGTATAKLVPLPRTHIVPPYPMEAKRAGEQGTTQMEVTISTLGVISECKVISSSGSQRLDATACSFVQRNWRWQPPTRDGREVSATTKVSVIWNLIAGR